MAEVGERVLNAPGREHGLPRPGGDDLLVQLEGELPLHHVERLVEVVVVQWRPGARPRRGLDHRDLAVALLAA